MAHTSGKGRSRSGPPREDPWGAWMAAAQDGDGLAYERLLREIVPMLRAFVTSRLRDPVAAEDVVQNVLLSMHRARHTYRPERPFAPWLRAIARNAITDLRREQARRRERETDAEVEHLEGAMPRVEAALSERLVRALDQLPGSQREAVALLHLEGLSVAEAAERAGVSPSALKVRAHRGYKALRQILGREEP